MFKAIRHGTSEVAVKRLDCLVDDAQKLQQMQREVAIMKKVSFDANIVQFYGACTTADGAWLMMEYMEVRNGCSQGSRALRSILCIMFHAARAVQRLPCCRCLCDDVKWRHHWRVPK